MPDVALLVDTGEGKIITRSLHMEKNQRVGSVSKDSL